MNQQFEFESKGYIPLAPVDEIIERSKPPTEVVVYERKKEVVEYVPKAQEINYTNIAKGLSFAGAIIGGGYLFVKIVIAVGVAALAWIEVNAAYIGGGFVLVILALFANEGRKVATDSGTYSEAGSNNSSKGGRSYSSGGNHYHYYQNNSFGGNAEQNNK